MRTQARVVVIGGGVVGVSTLYHLAKKGWSDVVLCERKALTSGSTWHAAGLLPLFNLSYSVGQIHQYSVDIYNDLERETGQSVGFQRVGNIRLSPELQYIVVKHGLRQVVLDRAVAVRHHGQVHVEERSAFRDDQHAFFASRCRNLLPLLAPRLVVVLDADCALRLQPAHVFARVV